MTDFMIIGSGVAGMAAAECLTEAGASLQVIDKAPKPGGRCATRRIEPATDAPWFDYGAQYFTARDERLSALVEQDLTTGRLATWKPAIARAEKAGPTWLLTPSPDDRRRLIGPRGLNHWVRDRLAAAGINIHCASHATHLGRGGHRWQVITDDGRRLSADRVLVTTPATQAQALLGSQAAYIKPLAEADQALSACHSLVIEAPALADAQAIFIDDGALSWAADNSHKAGVSGQSTHLWTLHAGAEYSDARVETPTRELAGELMAEFASITGQSVADLSLLHAHRWRYARPGPGAPDDNSLCWCDADEGLALAGDWLAGGRVEGAWLSGVGAAQRLLAG